MWMRDILMMMIDNGLPSHRYRFYLPLTSKGFAQPHIAGCAFLFAGYSFLRITFAHASKTRIISTNVLGKAPIYYNEY